MSQLVYVEPLPSGRFRVRTRIGGKLRTLDTFDTQDEAEVYRAHFAGVLAGSAAARDVALSTFGERVLTKRELRGKLRDPASDWSRFRTHVETDEIAALPVRALERSHVEDWLERLEDKGLAEQTIRNCRTVLSTICTAAIKARLLKTNPVLGIRREPEKRTEEPWTYATCEEQPRLVDAAEAVGVGEIIEVAMGTGMREGEQCALRLADVHLTGPDPHIVVRYGGPPEARFPDGPPPKYGRIRRVQLFGMAKRALERWIDRIAGAPNPHGLAFPRLGGGRWDAGGFRDPAHIIPWEVWKGAPERVTKARGKVVPRKVGIVEAAGITRPFRWHDLRHTFGSSLVSGWWGRRWELIEVRDVMGHRDITTTQRYAHLGDTAAKRAAREAEAMFQAVPGDRTAAPKSDAISGSHPRELNPRPTVYEVSGDRNVSAGVAPPVEQTWNRARALLEAAAAGDAARVHALAPELAREVLAAPAVALALRVLAGGEHAVSAAVELAELLGCGPRELAAMGGAS